MGKIGEGWFLIATAMLLVAIYVGLDELAQLPRFWSVMICAAIAVLLRHVGRELRQRRN
jgi:hypothetical protein